VANWPSLPLWSQATIVLPPSADRHLCVQKLKKVVPTFIGLPYKPSDCGHCIVFRLAMTEENYAHNFSFGSSLGVVPTRANSSTSTVCR
jgi:hypothetical protein